MGRTKMSDGKPLFVCLALAIGSASIAVAGEKPISSIRKAAIERLQQKLGSLRGSIAYEDHIIMLTNRLLEMQKPVRQSSFRVRGSRGFDTLTTGGTLSAIDANSSLYALERKSRLGGLTPAAGAVPLGPDEDDYIEVADQIIDDHGL